MHDTSNKPVDPIDIKLRGILNQIDPIEVNPTDTSVQLPTSYDGTASQGNNIPVDLRHNRKVCRYAKKHKITAEEAFKRLYK